MNRKEHLQWCKDRALQYVESGDVTNAFSSFMSDMGKHEETSNHLALEMGMTLMLFGNLSTNNQMKDWIKGFNENYKTMKELLTKIAKVKSEIGKISKDLTNPFFNSKYFDINQLLEHVEPLLESNGLLLLQPIENDQVISMIFEVESGESISSGLKLPELSDPQKIGSCISYYRRYTLQSLLAIQAEDDDANKASATNNNDNSDDKKWLNPNTTEWNNAVSKRASLEKVREHYKLSKENATLYLDQIK